jgi:LuxR family transcriptional regulator, maltose regulon positive regulatory protein
MPERTTNHKEARRRPRFASSKFAAPKAGFPLVHRARLMGRLDEGEDARLTLVVGSAGAGKTILLVDWLAGRPDRPSAWLSCDPADSDPARFVAALIDALRRAVEEPGLGEDATELLAVDGDVSADTIASLADDVQRLGVPAVLVIDDFHLTGVAGAEVLTWLLECRPAHLQVVLATRVDPALRLNRMRTNHELVEVRERELSFSAEETKQLLSRFGVQLSNPEIAVVQRRSEGWAAGLQMVAISMQHRSAGGGPAARVDLNRHTVAAYFLDEVLLHQPEPVVQFLLTTSVLDELTVDACTAVSGAGAASLLERVYRDHLFVSLVDDAAGTYRYHQLIKEVLRAELHARDPLAERQLHERAARYLADTGRVGGAARQLLEAGDAATAFRLLSEGVLLDYGTNPAPGSALDDIQPDDFSGHPEILAPLAAELLLRGDFDRGSRAFELAATTGTGTGSQPDVAFRFAVVGSMYHHFRGEEHEALAFRDRAQELVAQTAGSQDWLVSVDATGAYSHLHLGHFDEALQLAQAVAAAEATPPPARAMFYPGVRSQVAWAQGALSEADTWASRALEPAERMGFERHPIAFLALRTKVLLALEWRDLTRAAELNEAMLDVRRPFLSFLAQVTRAHIWAAGGNLDEALASLPAARTALRSDRSVLLAQADELEARVRLALGDQRGAAAVTARLPDDRRPVISAMTLLNANEPERARAVLDALSSPPATVRSDLELQLLHADAAIVLGSHQAPRFVREALEVVDRYGFIQTVLDTAPHMVEHLISDSDRYPRREHLGRLIAAAVDARRQRPVRAQASNLADPLTEAEIKVLRRLAERLTYADIASDLYLSLNTVKTHLRRSYMKLGVSSRSEAVKRAATLGFL